MLTTRQRSELLRRYRRRLDRLTLAGGARLAAEFAALGSLDDTDIDRLAVAAGPDLTRLAQRAADTTSATVAVLTDRPVAAASAIVEPDWRGPFTMAWAALGRGEPYEVAVESGTARADAAGRNSVVSSARGSASTSAPDVERWQRILDADPCPWCVTVSGQTYHTAQSADFGHDRCGCLVVPAA